MNINTQPKSKIDHKADGFLNVHSVFGTLQGEGPYAGRPAVFVRLTGCNLQCPACDTEYTEDNTKLRDTELLDIVDSIAESNGPNKINLIVITGGEPFRQNISEQVLTFTKAGYTVQIETNGTIFLEDFPYSLVTVVCSPKAKVNKKLAPYIDAYKYVISSGSVDIIDGLPIQALDHPVAGKISRPLEDFSGTIYVQPADAGDERINEINQKLAIDSCIRFGYTYCHQIHKTLNLE
jgi:organic radical activating enzyme